MKQPNLMFSVAPSGYVDISNQGVDGDSDDLWEDLSDIPFVKKKPMREMMKKKTVSKRSREEERTSKSKKLKGGGSRFRRMVTNNNTIQSAYMCL